MRECVGAGVAVVVEAAALQLRQTWYGALGADDDASVEVEWCPSGRLTAQSVCGLLGASEATESNQRYI